MKNFCLVLLGLVALSTDSHANVYVDEANRFFYTTGVSENPDGSFYVARPQVMYNGAYRYILFDANINDFLCAKFDFARSAGGYQAFVPAFYPSVSISASDTYVYYPEYTFDNQMKVFSGLLCVR